MPHFSLLDKNWVLRNLRIASSDNVIEWLAKMGIDSIEHQMLLLKMLKPEEKEVPKTGLQTYAQAANLMSQKKNSSEST